jgi:hypothetical protein
MELMLLRWAEASLRLFKHAACGSGHMQTIAAMPLPAMHVSVFAIPLVLCID